MQKYLIFGALAICLAVFSFFWLQDEQSEGENAAEEESHPTLVQISEEVALEHGIGTQAAQSGTLTLLLSSSGKVILHPDNLAHILPKVSGAAKDTLKNLGDPVRKGEVVAILESREMADRKATYLAALERVYLTSILYEKEQQLFDKKASSEQEKLLAKGEYEEAKGNLRLAKHKLHELGLKNSEIEKLADQNENEFNLYLIRSPLEGIITARDITKGENIEEGSVIYEIADLRNVWVDMGIFPRDLARVKEGQMVKVEDPVQKKVGIGKIIYLSPLIQEGTIAAKAIAELDNEEGTWLPGTFVQVSVATDSVQAPLVVCKEAVQVIEGKTVVFVQCPEGFSLREVSLGREDNEQVEILEGLKEGEGYAVTNTFLLKADLGKDSVEDD